MVCGTTTIRITINAKDPETLRQACREVQQAHRGIYIIGTEKGDILVTGVVTNIDQIRNQVTQTYTALTIMRQMTKAGYNVSRDIQQENIVLVAEA